MAATTTGFRPVRWEDGTVVLIDQTRLPTEEVWLEITDYRKVVSAIKALQIRGAPAIGIAGAYAVSLAAMELSELPADEFMLRLKDASREIAGARPTAVNLQWAVDRVLASLDEVPNPQRAVDILIEESKNIHEQDEKSCHSIGEFGAPLLPQGGAVLTHCNTGALATGGYGTALGVIRTAWSNGRISRVYATETRPLLQGARLTAWELVQANIAATLLPDSAAGQLMRRGMVQSVIVGADRIAANGDVANKIGTYTLAVLAREHSIPFFVAAPTSTVDINLKSGDLIPIEERSRDEVANFSDRPIAPAEIDVMNVAFDVTPSEYVSAIITEKGVVRDPYNDGLRQMVEAANG